MYDMKTSNPFTLLLVMLFAIDVVLSLDTYRSSRRRRQHVMARDLEPLSDGEIQCNFNKYDADHNSMIDVVEFVPLTSDKGIDEANAKEVFVVMDTNNDGDVSMEEFADVIRELPRDSPLLFRDCLVVKPLL